jgi:hypothetical protein
LICLDLRGKTKLPKRMDLNIILEKPSLLASLTGSSNFLAQFPSTLYRFFQVHKKEDVLISFVVQQEFKSGNAPLDVFVLNWFKLTSTRRFVENLCSWASCRTCFQAREVRNTSNGLSCPLWRVWPKQMRIILPYVLLKIIVLISS